MKRFYSTFASRVIVTSLLLASSNIILSDKMITYNKLKIFFMDNCRSEIIRNYATASIPVKSNNSVQGPYEMMHVAFSGSPAIHEIKPMLEAVIEYYGLAKTDETRLKVGSMLVSLRKGSVKGVSEMAILRHIHDYGSNKISLPDQAGLSVTILELNR